MTMDFCKLCEEEVSGISSPNGDLVCECGWVLAHGVTAEAHVEDSKPHNYDVSSCIAASKGVPRESRKRKRLDDMQQQLSVKTTMRMNPETYSDMQRRNSDTLHLPASTLEVAVDIYDTVTEHEKPRGVNRRALLPLSLYLACKAEAKVRIVKMSLLCASRS